LPFRSIFLLLRSVKQAFVQGLPPVGPFLGAALVFRLPLALDFLLHVFSGAVEFDV
jgi:hypothetical protein